MPAAADLLIQSTLLLLASAACVSGGIVRHTFQVQTLVTNRSCQEDVIVAINGRYPGPTIYAHEGDTIIIHVSNKSPANITIHWHGVKMLFNGWADGAEYVTQCPLLPGHSYTYKFNVKNQEGTLFWHAHSSWLRAFVHGAFIIYPRDGLPYPFQKPYKEIPILLGEWFSGNVINLENQFLHENENVAGPSGFTINGHLGDSLECSSKDMYKLKVRQGKTYLLRIINVGLNNELFFTIANHKMTVVAVDASYTLPYTTDAVYIAPGQTVDVLLEADQPPTSYYMTSYAHISRDSRFTTSNQSVNGILVYLEASSLVLPILPKGPDYRDVLTAHKFSADLRGLTNVRFWVPVPQEVDEQMIITAGMGLGKCQGDMGVCSAPYGGIVHSSMNNMSFELPTEMSMLEAFYRNVSGVYTVDFPNEPPTKFDYANLENPLDESLVWIGERGTKVKKLRYNASIQVVFQGTNLLVPESHPIHLHGYSFHVLAQGFGNYDPTRDEKKFNLINPQLRHTISVPRQGWVVIRFRANNPGVWLMHCHLAMHQSVGLGTAFVVENGFSQATSLPPPPMDFPTCTGGLDNTSHQDQIVSLPIGKANMLDIVK